MRRGKSQSFRAYGQTRWQGGPLNFCTSLASVAWRAFGCSSALAAVRFNVAGEWQDARGLDSQVGAPRLDAFVAMPGDIDLSTILERISDSFFMLDSRWKIKACNAEHERITRLPRREQVGCDFRELFLHNSGADGERFLAHYLRAMLSRKSLSFTEYYAPLDFWVDCRVFPTDCGGLAVFCRNVTEVHKSYLARARDKHRYESMFSTSPAAMAFLRGEELVFEHVNERYTALIGGREAAGRRFAEVLHELVDEPFQQMLRDVLRTGAPYVELERKVRYICRRDCPPEDRFVNFAYKQICGLDGAPDGVYIFVEDVTDQVRGRQQLLESMRARDDFMSFCSHELKTPLTALKMAVQATKRKIERDKGDSVPRQTVQRMLDKWDVQVDRMTLLIDEMADFSRINRGNLVLRPAPCDLGSIVADVLQRLDAEVRARHVNVAVATTGDLTGLWDAMRLEQLCINLLSNALKYGDAKPVAVRIEGGADEVVLEVTDRGQGVAEADRQRIFLAYERASEEHRGGSLGVGLFISRCIVEAHGGSVEVVSSSGPGTTFRVVLPKGAKPSSTYVSIQSPSAAKGT